MKLEKFSSSCPLDCYDMCKFDVYKSEGKVVKILGNKENLFTKGIICPKGIKHMENLYSKDRIKKPLIKIDGTWEEISFEKAVGIVSERLTCYKEKHGSSSVLHYFQSGTTGFLKKIEDIFFNFYGGITTSKGSTCWGAGNQAQEYDFGGKRSSNINDILNSKTIILWGRNPFNTSIHLHERILAARKNNIKIVTVDPRVNESSKFADIHISPNPSTDGALAMAVTKYIIRNKGYDREYLKKYIVGFKEYFQYLDTLTMEYLVKEAGITMKEIETLGNLLMNKPVSCFLGYGMQKYTNGGNTVRAIDALFALSGNIGIKGGGIFYSNLVYPSYINNDPYDSARYAKNSCKFWVSDFVGYLNKRKKEDKPIKAVFISKANPMNQFPNLNESIEVFNKIDFKVCIDMFLTDTAKYCDLFIPCTNTLESEDIIYSPMHNPYMVYNEKISEPDHRLMDEYYFFQEVAKTMKMNNYPQVEKDTYLSKVLSPLDITLDQLKLEDINLYNHEIAWEDMVFLTPSKKIEIYSEKAKSDGHSPIPVYISSLKPNKEYPMRIINPHFKQSLFSQHMYHVEGFSKLYIGETNMKDLQEGDIVRVTSKYGSIRCSVYSDNTLPKDLVYMFSGWHHKHGNPNFLTFNGSSEMGGQTAFYDTFIKIDKIY